MAGGDWLLALVYMLAPHRLHRRAAREARRLGERILDVGGGAGHLARALAEDPQGPPRLYVLVDPDPLLVSMAPRGAWVEAVIGVGEALPLRGGAVDVAVFHDSLHHIPSLGAALREAARVARCVLVDDIDASRPLGRLVMLLERLAGYPAAFTMPEALARELRGLGLVPRRLRAGGLPGSYMVAACRASLGEGRRRASRGTG